MSKRAGGGGGPDEASASTSISGGSGGSGAKRARFADSTTTDDDDGAGTGVDLDLEEQDRKRLQQGRRGRVVTAGYDSDDDDDDDEEGGDAGNAPPEEEDMFGEGEAAAAAKKEKDPPEDGGERFLQLGEIEGQEFGTVSRAPGEAGDLSEDDEEQDAELQLESDDDDGSEGASADSHSLLADANGAAERTPSPLLGPDGEELVLDAAALEQRRAARRGRPSRAKRGMGFRLDSFNMKGEMATGRFDADGNYTANERDPHAEHDSWLTGHYSRKGIRAAREARRRREEEQGRREAQHALLDEDDVKHRLVPLLQPGESVMEALQRLGKEAEKWRPPSKTHTKRSYGAKNNKQRTHDADTATPMDLDAAAPTHAAATHAPPHPSLAALEELTSLSSTLMARFGNTGIYDETYESLLRAVRRAGLVRADWDPARVAAADAASTTTAPSAPSHAAPPRYSYKWTPAYLSASARLTGQPVDPETRIFGPYEAQELREWCDGGFFGYGGERVLLRREEGEGEQGAEERGAWRRWGEVFK